MQNSFVKMSSGTNCCLYTKLRTTKNADWEKTSSSGKFNWGTKLNVCPKHSLDNQGTIYRITKKRDVKFQSQLLFKKFLVRNYCQYPNQSCLNLPCLHSCFVHLLVLNKTLLWCPIKIRVFHQNESCLSCLHPPLSYEGRRV